MFTDGSIAGYDAVLAVSEEAINKQLEVLYNTEIKGKAAVVSEIEGYMPTVPAKFLINRDIWLQPTMVDDDTKETVISGEGIKGHIECPRISLKDQDPGYVKLTMKFAADETRRAEVPGADTTDPPLPTEVHQNPADSWLYHYVGHGARAKLKGKKINGWTVSWRAKLAQEYIQNIMEDLIQPARSNGSIVTAPENLTKKLEKVASEDFLVSSLFCTMEAHDVMETMVIAPADPKDDLLDTEQIAFQSLLANYHRNMKTKPGIPNPNNPFVLGYGISQTLPTLKQDHPDLNTNDTPKYFIPRNFHFSTTKGSGFTNGTLNYLILTHRPLDSQRNEEQGRDRPGADRSGAGDITHDFFSITKQRAETSNAVMSFCKDAFLSRWLGGDILEKIHITLAPNFDFFWKAADMVHGMTDSGGVSHEYEHFDNNTETVGGAPHPTVQYTQDWMTKKTNIVRVMQLGGCDVQQFGKSTTRIEVLSDLQQWPNADAIPDDRERSIYLVIRWRYMARYMFETWGPGHVGGTSEAYSQKIAFGFKEIVKVTAKGDSAGDWRFEQHMPGSTLPTSAGDFAKRMAGSNVPEDNIHEYSITDEQGDNYAATGSKGHGVASVININDYIHLFPSFPNTIAPLACFAVDNLVRELAKAIDHQQFLVMMPAGEAFFYKGLDCDDQGNLYSHLNYKMGAAGAHNN